MSTETDQRLRQWLRRIIRRLPLDRGDAPWLGAGLGAGLLVVGIYLATNPYSAYGAGLYVQIAKTIVSNSYLPPATVPGYTADGVPFAYPPLQFYLLAVLLDVGADPVELARLLPSVGVLAALVPTYLFARDYTDSRPAGGAASVAVALNPQLLQWHISAGGVVRAFAFCYAMVAIYAGYHLFRDGDRRTAVLGLLAFAATVLTHPTYSLFVVVTYLLLWATTARTVEGLVHGAFVGGGGAVLASPWLVWAATIHGPEIFLAASGTHGGVGGGAIALLDEFSTFTLIPLIGAAYLLVQRRDWFLASWAVAAELLFAQPRFAFTVGSVVAAAVGVDVAGRLDALSGSFAGGADRKAVAAAACLLLASVGGSVYLSHEMTLERDPSTPEFLDDEAVDAMAWAAAETRPDATFVVLGDAAEWFPALTDRTIIVAPWGVEWRGPDPYERHLDAFETVSACHSVACVETQVVTVDGDPEYVYVPKGKYTVRGERAVSFGTLERSFQRSPRWERAFENEGVVIYRLTDR